ncbi:hypothetical protein [Bacillus sp. LL01]|uniref:hypothetical protein n=1 Tax=Bacillus sp. LL01 TaxID=1665556 RepID=UPI001F526A65|nr:hypothetical protein [Bacillus sp. LL01]
MKYAITKAERKLLLMDMVDEHENHIIDTVISLLDILVIIQIEDDPIIGIVLVALLKIVTKDRLIRILFILLVIILGEVSEIES